MSNTPMVSVLIPAYNADKFIGAAITSVLNQTFKDFELCILNDGSTDRTAEIIDQFNDPRIIKIHQSQNSGLVSVRNTLIALARGKYIAYLDNDDVAFPDRLAKQYAFLEADKADICSGDYETFNEETGEKKLSKVRYSDADIKALITVYCPLCNPAVMGRAEIFKKFPYIVGNDHAEDYSLWQEIALAGYRFANLRDKLIIYRIHPKQISRLALESASLIFDRCRTSYISGLGISPDLTPKKMYFYERLQKAPQFLLEISRRFRGVSFSANCQIYSRFQYRRNGILTPLTRFERFLFSGIATLLGKF